MAEIGEDNIRLLLGRASDRGCPPAALHMALCVLKGKGGDASEDVAKLSLVAYHQDLLLHAASREEFHYTPEFDSLPSAAPSS